MCCGFLYVGFSFIIDYFLFNVGDKDRDYIIIDIVIFRIMYLFLCLCFLGSMIISGILFIYYFYDDFHFLCVCM